MPGYADLGFGGHPPQMFAPSARPMARPVAPRPMVQPTPGFRRPADGIGDLPQRPPPAFARMLPNKPFSRPMLPPGTAPNLSGPLAQAWQAQGGAVGAPPVGVSPPPSMPAPAPGTAPPPMTAPPAWMKPPAPPPAGAPPPQLLSAVPGAAQAVGRGLGMTGGVPNKPGMFGASSPFKQVIARG